MSCCGLHSPTTHLHAVPCHDRAPFLEASGDRQQKPGGPCLVRWLLRCSLSDECALPCPLLLGCWAAELETKEPPSTPPPSIESIPFPPCPVWVAVPVRTEQHSEASGKAAVVEQAWPPFLCRGHSASGPSHSHEKRDYKNESVLVTGLEQGLTLHEGSIRVYHHRHLNACNPGKPGIHSHFTGEKTGGEASRVPAFTQPQRRNRGLNRSLWEACALSHGACFPVSSACAQRARAHTHTCAAPTPCRRAEWDARLHPDKEAEPRGSPSPNLGGLRAGLQGGTRRHLVVMGVNAAPVPAARPFGQGVRRSRRASDDVRNAESRAAPCSASPGPGR